MKYPRIVGVVVLCLVVAVVIAAIQYDENRSSSIRYGEYSTPMQVPEGPEVTTSLPSFATKSLYINGLLANLDVKVAEGTNTMHVSVTGPQNMVKSVETEVRQQRRELFIKGGKVGKASNLCLMRCGVGNGVSVNGGNIVLTVTVTVPPGTPVSAYTNFGTVNIGDTRADMDLWVSFDGAVTIGKVGMTHVHLTGPAHVSIAEVNGPYFTTIIDGSGTIKVGGGKVDTLFASVPGTGEVDFNGTATNAITTTQGPGTIKVLHVTANNVHNQANPKSKMEIGQ